VVSRGTAGTLLVLGLIGASAMLYYGFTLPRPEFPTPGDASLGCKLCNSTALFERYVLLIALYDQATLQQRSLVQVGTGILVGVPAALVLASLPTGEPRTRNERRMLVKRQDTAKTLIGAAVLAAGAVSFAVIAWSDIYYAHTGDGSSLAFRVILFCDSLFGQNVGFSIAAALSLGQRCSVRHFHGRGEVFLTASGRQSVSWGRLLP